MVSFEVHAGNLKLGDKRAANHVGEGAGDALEGEAHRVPRALGEEALGVLHPVLLHQPNDLLEVRVIKSDALLRDLNAGDLHGWSRDGGLGY